MCPVSERDGRGNMLHRSDVSYDLMGHDVIRREERYDGRASVTAIGY